MVLMTFRTINLNMRASQELDFRLITTSKNNFGEIKISRSTLYDCLSVQCINLSCFSRYHHAHEELARRLNRELREVWLIVQSKQQGQKRLHCFPEIQ